jgi:DNA-binding phage protein
MAKRSKNWDESLSKRLRDKEFAKNFLLALMEDEGLTLKEALRETIQCYGVSEFSELCGVAQPNITRVLDERSNPTLTTIEKLLEPFSLSVGAKDSGAA